ncbi:MAG: hypothetical protein HY841_03565 [Bacteroidetes bacterium]|nr:hypothetical protein [Bacteroidota bacterium]
MLYRKSTVMAKNRMKKSFGSSVYGLRLTNNRKPKTRNRKPSVIIAHPRHFKWEEWTVCKCGKVTYSAAPFIRCKPITSLHYK